MLACSAIRHGDIPATHTVTVPPAGGGRVVGLCEECAGRYERIRAGSTVMPPAVPIGD